MEDEEAELARAESMLARLTSPALAAAKRLARGKALATPGLAGEGIGNSGSVVSWQRLTCFVRHSFRRESSQGQFF